MNIETETIDKLFLELSQFTQAKTKRETELELALNQVRAILEKPASNRQFMQIADPARQCLNVINSILSK